MKLMTKELERRFRAVGKQEIGDDPIVIAKFFNPNGRGVWYATEYDPITNEFFGYASFFTEEYKWLHFSLLSLQVFSDALNVRLERDLECGEKRLSQFEIVQTPLLLL